MCGEHSPAIPFTESLWGSSPCAGNTNIPIIAVVDDRDHPRVRGTLCVFSVERRDSRIIPRVRGTHEILGRIAAMSGIIPACAGNTERQPLRHLRFWDHPRVCGNTEWAFGTAVQAGIIPRVRGTRRIVQFAHSPYGIIRVCGEHGDMTKLKVMKKGSSPRVRGTPVAVRL